MRRLAQLLAILATLSLVALVGASGPTDTTIAVQYGTVPLAMPYNGANGSAVVAARQVATSSVGNVFNAGVRTDMIAQTGGVYNYLTQPAYFGVNAQVNQITQGQGFGYWGFVNGLGKGNSGFGNGYNTCYGGGAVELPSATPECSALGEFESDQGTYVWSGTVSGSPSTGATTINYTSPTNNTYLGARYILNKNRTTGAAGTISAITSCVQGSASPCPGTCPGGTNSVCSVVQFTGSPISTAAGIQWYFKTGYTSDYYSGSCNGDDVSLPNAGGAGVAECVGHWYNVAQVQSANQILLYDAFDYVNLGKYLGTANYILYQGTDASDVNQSGQTITLPSNSFSWANGDFIYSPPNHYMAMIGANVIMTKQFKTGYATAPSDGLRIVNYGPQPVDDGILIAGGGTTPGVNGGFRYAIDIENMPIVSSGPSGTVVNNNTALRIGTDVNYAIVMNAGSLSPAKNVIYMGTGSQVYQDSTTGTLSLDGTDTRVQVGLYGDGSGVKHKRLTTGSVVASGFVTVTVTWATAFADVNYTPVCTVLDASGNLTVPQISAQVAASIGVDVKNGDAANPHTGTLLCHAFHD